MENNRPNIDMVSLIAISILAWCSVNIFHEIIGHAGSAVVMGIPVHAVSTTTFYSEWGPMNTVAQSRIVNAAGPVMNLVTGAIALVMLRLSGAKRTSTNYFLWLFSTFSFIIVTINLISAPLIGGGDFSEILRTVDNPNFWKPIIIGIGVILTIIGYILPLRLWIPDLRGNRRTLLKITLTPVVVAIVVQTMSLIGSPFAKLPPDQNHLLASVFAFLHLILWVILVNILPVPRSRLTPKHLELPRSNVVIIMGLLMGLLFIGLLGPGLGPFEEDPRLVLITGFHRIPINFW
jgi:hypothetical protein